MKKRPFTTLFAVLLAALLLSAASIDANASPPTAALSEGGGEDDPNSGDRTSAEQKLYKIAGKIARITQVFIYLIGVFFVGRMLLVIFSSQINLVGGKPGAVADMASEMVYALISFLLAVDTPRLAEAFAAIALNRSEAATSSDIAAMGTVIEPIAGFVIGLLGTLVFVGFVVNFVFTGVQAVVNSAIGSPGGMSAAISTGISLVFTLLLGFAFLRTGQWIFQNYFHL